MAMFCVLVFVFSSITPVVFSDQVIDNFIGIPVPATGPAVLAFGPDGDGPYTGISDGRILRYGGPDIGFTEFAYVSPNRTKDECDGTTDANMGAICGRPIGLAFNYKTKELYIADAFYKLCKVGMEGGLAQQVATVADGVALEWLDGIDVDQNTGVVYVTQPSTQYDFTEIDQHLSTNDTTGRIISYDPSTEEIKVLMTDLRGPGGVAVSKDSYFILVSETPGNKISKFWLKGSKAMTQEHLLDVPQPAKFKRTPVGDFWVASNVQTQNPTSLTIPRGLRIDGFGNILETLVLSGIYDNSFINDFQRFENSYYVGSILLDFAGVGPVRQSDHAMDL